MNPDFEKALLASYTRSQRFPDEHICPRAFEGPMKGNAVWDSGQHCSFCGSLHPDVLMERIEAGTVQLVPTDKNYKIYVCSINGGEPFRRSYREAGSPGGNDPSKWEWTTREVTKTKCYFQHFAEHHKQRFVELLNAGSLKIDYPGRFYCLPYFVVKQEKSV